MTNSHVDPVCLTNCVACQLVLVMLSCLSASDLGFSGILHTCQDDLSVGSVLSHDRCLHHHYKAIWQLLNLCHHSASLHIIYYTLLIIYGCFGNIAHGKCHRNACNSCPLVTDSLTEV